MSVAVVYSAGAGGRRLTTQHSNTDPQQQLAACSLQRVVGSAGLGRSVCQSDPPSQRFVVFVAGDKTEVSYSCCSWTLPA